MKNSDLKNRVLNDMEGLIDKSCPDRAILKKDQALHEAIVKKHYNAAEISINYHRKRIIMEIIMDDTSYDPQKLNFSLPLLRTNMIFNDLRGFLMSCLDNDPGSIAFYAKLVRSYEDQDRKLAIARVH